jgi:sugar (pentulose or hexulose) kinase
VDGTSGTVVLRGRGDGFAGPGVMYDDARGRAHAPRVQEVGAPLWERLGYRIGSSWALPTLLTMLAEHDGDRAGLRVAHQVDVVTEALVGHPVATDSSSALKTGYDLLELRWPDDVLATLGLDPALLPDVVLPGRVLGAVGADAAGATGLPHGTPVVAGMTDGCAAQLGAGAVTTGAWNSVLGTTLIIKGVTGELLHDPAGTVYSHRGPGGSWLPGGASSTGAGVLGELIATDRVDAATEELASRGLAR